MPCFTRAAQDSRAENLGGRVAKQSCVGGTGRGQSAAGTVVGGRVLTDGEEG